jgi:hypothetical protein
MLVINVNRKDDSRVDDVVEVRQNDLILTFILLITILKYFKVGS